MCVCVCPKRPRPIPYIKSGLLYFCGRSLDSIYWRSHPERIKKEAVGEKKKKKKCHCYAQVICILYGSWRICVCCALYIYVRDVSERELPIQLGELELYRKQEHTYIYSMLSAYIFRPTVTLLIHHTAYTFPPPPYVFFLIFPYRYIYISFFCCIDNQQLGSILYRTPFSSRKITKKKIDPLFFYILSHDKENPDGLFRSQQQHALGIYSIFHSTVWRKIKETVRLYMLGSMR
jgi:hypothetical protein